MAAQLRGQQISALLESLPGIASVLRSPVADAIVNMIRAGAGLRDFHESDANELVQYAVRRGLLGSEEGGELLVAIRGAGKKKARRKPSAKKVMQKATASKTARTGKKKAAPVAKAVPKVKAKKATKTVKKKAKKKR